MPTPAKTVELHRLQGTEQRVKEQPASSVLGGRAKMPSHLTRAERATFKHLHALLEERRHVTPGDELILAQAATLAVRWVKAKTDVEHRGFVVESVVLDSHGQPVTTYKKNPMLTLAQESEKALLAILDRLGLAPVAREKIKRAAPVPSEEPYPEGSLGWLRQQKETKHV